MKKSQYITKCTFHVFTYYSSTLSKSYNVTVALTHAELFDKKNKSRLLHDVMPQGRGYALESDKYLPCKLPKLSYRGLGRRKQFQNTLSTDEGNKKHVEILVGRPQAIKLNG
jgi:hypothetical protein